MVYSIKHSVIIAKPIHEIFDFHANLLNHVDWHDHIITVDVISDIKEGIGATFRVVNKVGWMTNTDIREIIAYDRPHSFTYQLTTNSVTGTSQQILESVDEGTRFTVIGEFQMSGIARFFEPMIAKRVDAHIAEAVIELKHYMENNLQVSTL